MVSPLSKDFFEQDNKNSEKTLTWPGFLPSVTGKAIDSTIALPVDDLWVTEFNGERTQGLVEQSSLLVEWKHLAQARDPIAEHKGELQEIERWVEELEQSIHE